MYDDTSSIYYSDLNPSQLPQPPSNNGYKRTKQLPQIPRKNSRQVDQINHNNNYFDENTYQDQYYFYENPVCQTKSSLDYELDEFEGSTVLSSGRVSAKKHLPAVGSSGVILTSSQHRQQTPSDNYWDTNNAGLSASETDPLSYNSRPFQNIGLNR